MQKLIEALEGISRLAKSRDMLSTNFQLNVIAETADEAVKSARETPFGEMPEADGTAAGYSRHIADNSVAATDTTSPVARWDTPGILPPPLDPPLRPETYLGDGVYASFDGESIILRVPRERGDEFVYLDFRTFTELVQFERTSGWR